MQLPAPSRAAATASCDIVLGIVGAIVGGFLMRVVFHFNATGFIADIIVGIIGAVIMLLIGKAFSRPSPRYY